MLLLCLNTTLLRNQQDSHYKTSVCLKHDTFTTQLLSRVNYLSLQACKTTLNITEVLELQGVSYEELEETYNKARQLAQQASSLKLEATVLRGLLGVQKVKGYDALARECYQMYASLRWNTVLAKKYILFEPVFSLIFI
jgi:hypothetical protein